MEVPKHCSREREKKKRGGDIYGQATKGAARKEASVSYMGKDTGIL